MMVFYEYPSGALGHSAWIKPAQALWLIKSFQRRGSQTKMLYAVRRYPHHTKIIRKEP